MTERFHGTVKWFDNKKGYGFIEQDGSTDDIFVHYGEIGGSGFKSLVEGQRVEFDLVKRDRGFGAADVIKLESATS